MLKEAHIHLPVLDNEGHSLRHVHTALAQTLVSLFGGCTETRANGYWRDEKTGILHAEEVVRYTVAMEASAVNQGKLNGVAKGICKAANQVCIYVSHATGEVEFVS